jgi:hypothetical protein
VSGRCQKLTLCYVPGRCQKLTLCYVQAYVMENYFGMNNATAYLRKVTEVGLESLERSVFIYLFTERFQIREHFFNIYKICMFVEKNA